MSDETQSTGGESGSGGGSGSISIGVTPTDGTQGSILFIGAAGVVDQDNASFFYNKTDKISYIGANSGAFTNTRHHIQGGVNSFLQANLINTSNGGSASGDFIVTADNGTDTTNFIDMGRNSSGFNDAAFTIAQANAGYLYNAGGSLAVGTSTGNSIIFFTNGTLAANKRMDISSTGLVNIGNAAANASGIGLVRIGDGVSFMDMGQVDTVGCGIWMVNVAPTTTNYTVRGTTSSAIVNGASSTTGVVSLRVANSEKASFGVASTTFTLASASTGALASYTFTTPAHLTQTAGSETIGFRVDMGTNSIQHASNTTIALNRDFLVNARIHRWATATGTGMRMVTMAITGAPSSGTSSALTTVIGLEVEGGAVNSVNTPTTGYGAFFNATTGATTNWALGVNGNAVFQNRVFIGTSYGAGGCIHTNTTTTGNVGTGEDTLFTFSVPAATLSTNKDSIDGVVAGSFGASANNKRVRVKFGGTTIFDSGALAITLATDWAIEFQIIRTGATTQKCNARLTTSSATLLAYCDYTTAAETLSGAVTFLVTGEATSDNDVVGEMLKIQFIPAEA